MQIRHSSFAFCVSRSVLGRWCACDRVPWSNINYHYLSHCVLAVVVASRVAGVRTILMQVVAPRADAVRFGSVLPRIPPPPPESLVLSPSGLPAVVVASRVAGVRTILMQVVAPRADAVRFGSVLPRIPPLPPRNPWFCHRRACQLLLLRVAVPEFGRY